MAFNHKYNTDDAIIRAAIVGLVNELNNKIHYENVWSDTDKRVVRVPFFYAMSGDERFLQDYFSDWSDCAPDFIEGNTDPIPRGQISLTGVSILSSNLTSRYVRGYYNEEVDGELKRFNSYLNSIPIQMNFSAEILVDTVVDSFKIIQSIISTLYRTLTFSVSFKGFRVPTQAGFPDSYNSNKQFEFTYGVNERLKISFDVELQTYLPIPDGKEVFFAGKNMSGGFIFNVQSGGDAPSENSVAPAPNDPFTQPIGSYGSNESNYVQPGEDPSNSPGVESGPNPGLGGNNSGALGGYNTTPPDGYSDQAPRNTGGGGGGDDSDPQFNEGFWK